MPHDVAAALAGLFGAAFLSATLLPGGSEVALAAFLAHWPERTWLAVAVATAGNTLGGLTSFALGSFLPVARTSTRAVDLLRRYGVPMLLLSWLPVIGDALCVASGWLRHPWLAAGAAIATGKLLRYLAVAASMHAWWPASG